MYHKNKKINDTLMKLMEELCEDERYSGQKTTLVFIPQNKEEKILMIENGKPVPEEVTVTPQRIIEIAIMERNKI